MRYLPTDDTSAWALHSDQMIGLLLMYCKTRSCSGCYYYNGHHYKYEIGDLYPKWDLKALFANHYSTALEVQF